MWKLVALGLLARAQGVGWFTDWMERSWLCEQLTRFFFSLKEGEGGTVSYRRHICVCIYVYIVTGGGDHYYFAVSLLERISGKFALLLSFRFLPLLWTA